MALYDLSAKLPGGGTQSLADYRGISQMTFQHRFFPATLRARQLIDEGRLGRILQFRVAFLHGGSADPAAPMSVAGVLSKSSFACFRVWSMVDSGVRPSPEASPSTANRLTPSGVRAATRIKDAMWPSMT